MSLNKHVSEKSKTLDGNSKIKCDPHTQIIRMFVKSHV